MSGDGPDAGVILLSLESNILHAEAVYRTGDSTEDTYYEVGIDVTVADGVSATVVVTVESRICLTSRIVLQMIPPFVGTAFKRHAGIIADRRPRDSAQVDVSRLKEVDAGALVAAIAVFGY